VGGLVSLSIIVHSVCNAVIAALESPQHHRTPFFLKEELKPICREEQRRKEEQKSIAFPVVIL
jgi:hypothetical protein